MRQGMRFVPFWAAQFAAGTVVIALTVAVLAAVVTGAAQAPAAFFDEVGRTVSRLAPQPTPDLRTDDQLTRVIAAMPEGKMRVGSVVPEQNRVVFTVTADRSAVDAAVAPGDELRIGRDGGVEIVPTGIPGVADQLQRALDDLRRRFFGP